MSLLLMLHYDIFNIPIHLWSQFTSLGVDFYAPTLGVDMVYIYASIPIPAILLSFIQSFISLFLSASKDKEMIYDNAAAMGMLFLFCIAAGVPIAFSLGLSALVYLLVAGVPVTV